MDERTRRIGENEALFRTVNEEIESLSRGIAAVGGRIMHIVCECGDLACTERLAVQVGDYERIRREPALFFIRPGHEFPDVEEVVEETPDYHVVRKDEGEPESIARATDPRH
jgi:hypothetical protein